MDLALRKGVSGFARRWNLPGEAPANFLGDPRHYISPDWFESFATHYILNHHRGLGFDRLDIVSLITGGFRDSKIDALALVVNGELILTEEDLAVFEENDSSSDLDVEFIFIQATLREYLSQGKIANFCTGISNFLGHESLMNEGEQIAYWRALKNKILALMELRGSELKPRCTLYLAWPEQQTALPHDHHAILELRRRDLENSRMFREVAYEIVDGPRFLELLTQERVSNAARIRFDGLLPVHTSDGGASRIKASWLGYVEARDFVAAIEASDGAIRRELFFENVRHYLGESEGSINEHIAATIRSPAKSRFAMMNNGITIVARHAETCAGDVLCLRDFQIVNGCQTSHALHRNKDALDETVKVPIKVVSTDDEAVIHDIVVASNSQTEVDATQLLSRDPYVRRVQQQFESVWGPGRTRHIWFERRAGEHSGWRRTHGHRVVCIVDLIKSFASVFLERPHWVQNAKRVDLRHLVPEQVFNSAHDPALYYAAALIVWRAREFMAGQKGGEWRYPAKHHLALAIRVLAEPEPWKGPDGYRGAKRDLIAYLSTLRRVLWDEDRAREIVAEAHACLRAAATAMDRRFNSNLAKKEQLTRFILDEARARRTAPAETA